MLCLLATESEGGWEGREWEIGGERESESEQERERERERERVKERKEREEISYPGTSSLFFLLDILTDLQERNP